MEKFIVISILVFIFVYQIIKLKKMIVTNYKGFLIVREFHGYYDIRNTIGSLEHEGATSVKECKQIIDKWI